MEYKEGFGQLISQTRKKLAREDKERYSQAAVAQRIGISQTVYSRWENGEFDRIPEAEALAKLGAALNIAVPRLLEELGYEVGLFAIEEARIQRVVDKLELADYIHRKYDDIQSYQDLARTFEELIESRRIRESRAVENN